MQVARLLTPPASEPVDLGEVKEHLRLDQDDDHDTLERLIAAARAHVEEVTWRGLVHQTWELVLPEWPDCDEIELPKGNLASVTSVRYLDADAAVQTLAASSYLVDCDSIPGRIILAPDASWPSTYDRWDAVRIRYAVGWRDAAAASATAIHASLAGNAASNAFPGPFTQPDVPRSLSVTAAAGWNGGDVTIVGVDPNYRSISEVVTPVAGSTVETVELFRSVTSATKGAVGASPAGVSIGTGTALHESGRGVPKAIKQALLLLVEQLYDGVAPEQLGGGAAGALLGPYSLARVR